MRRSAPQANVTKKVTSRERRLNSVNEIPDPAPAEFHGARATSPPRTDRLKMPSPDYNRELALPSDELVSLRRRRNLRRQRRETSSQLRSPSSGMSPAEWAPKRSVRGGLVARALWIRPKPKSGTSRADDL